ncbi:MAG TPA: helix-turn-helix transcriptional regulator [Polyangiaceae bacterium]|nr:helix-turn-helix transcriptional regulator [Polyangiaceae bacterium]
MSSVLLELPGPRDAHGGLWYSTPASTRFGRHHHRELELNVLLAGEACYWFPHRELRVVAPAALWIPPGVEHELLEASPDLAMWVHSFRAPAHADSRLSASSVESPWCSALRELSDGPRVTGMPPVALARVCALSREGLLRPGLEPFNAVLRDIFDAAWSARCPRRAPGEPAACHPAALRAASLLREPDASQSMEALARSTPLSRERLSRVFARSFGIGLVQYRNHHRVQRFIREYGHGGGANMLRAALEVGFGSYVQFHRAFKQVVGDPPARHLERVRDGIVDPARTGGSECST